MTTKSLKFPSYFPSDCPPNDALAEELKVYRYCENDDVVLASDFITYYESDPNKYKNNVLAYGLSVMTSREQCLKGLQLPGLKKKFKSFATGITYTTTGVIKRTPNKNNPTHCTWWIYEGVQPEKYFVIE